MDTVFTLEEAAAFLKVHPSTIYRLLKKHRIPAFKIGSDWRFKQASVEMWIKEAERVQELGEPMKSTARALATKKPVRRTSARRAPLFARVRDRPDDNVI